MFCTDISNKVTDNKQHNKEEDLLCTFLFILECKEFIEKKAQDSSHNVIAGRRNPVRTAEHIEKQEHKPCPNKRVRHTDDEEFEQFFVKKVD